MLNLSESVRDSTVRLSSDSFASIPARSSERVEITVMDNEQRQTTSVSFSIRFSGTPQDASFVPSRLDFVIPPNDLEAVLAGPAEAESVGDPYDAMLSIEGLQAGKSLIISSADTRVDVPSAGIMVLEDQEPFSVEAVLRERIRGVKALPLTISYLDALRPTGRMSAEISASLSIGDTRFSCSIAADNRIACWGKNFITKVTDSIQVIGPNNEDGAFLAVSAGYSHTCAVRIDNRLACWGSRATANNEEVTGPNNEDGAFLAVSAGGLHTCGITAEDKIRCWGVDNEIDDDRVTGPNNEDGAFLAVSAGNAHTCVIRIDNTAACWGNNDTNQSSPTSNGTDAAEKFHSIKAGTNHTCGITTEDKVRCWGGFAVGDGSQITGPNNEDGAFLSVSPGGTHTCALRANGKPRCWGFFESNFVEGQRVFDGRVSSTPNKTLLAVSAGAFHNCAITAEGEPVCWGFGDEMGEDSEQACPQCAGFTKARVSPDTPPWLFEESQRIDDAVDINLEIRLRIRVFLEGALRR